MSVAEDSKAPSRFCIIGVATKLFAKLGLDKCSTREIAKQSETNVSLISYYFGGKEGLYKEVMRAHALQTRDQVQDYINEGDLAKLTREKFIQNITQIVDHLIKKQTENPEMTKIFSREKLAGFPHSKEIHSEIFYPLIQKFYKLFETAQKQGIIKEEVNPALFFITLSEGICGFFTLMDCDLPITNDCKSLQKDPILLRDQIISIYLTGVLK